MDTSKTNQIDLRQSQEWAVSLEMYGWKSVRTLDGVNIEIIANPIGSFAKVQKPHNLSLAELEEIERLAKEYKALLVIIEPGAGQDLEVLSQAGFVRSTYFLTPVKTLVLNLTQPENDLWAGLSYSAKYSINRAKREDAHVEFYTHPTEDKLKAFFAIYKETGQAKNYATKSWEDLQRRTQVFGDQSHLALVYDKENNLAGGKFYLGHGKNVWYIYGGTAKAARKNKAGYLLLWESLLQLKNLGYEKLDLDGIYDSRFPGFLTAWGGFSHFKEKFGGEAVTFPVARVKYFNPLLKLLFKFGNFNL